LADVPQRRNGRITGMQRTSKGEKPNKERKRNGEKPQKYRRNTAVYEKVRYSVEEMARKNKPRWLSMLARRRCWAHAEQTDELRSLTN